MKDFLSIVFLMGVPGLCGLFIAWVIIKLAGGK